MLKIKYETKDPRFVFIYFALHLPFNTLIIGCIFHNLLPVISPTFSKILKISLPLSDERKAFFQHF